MKQILRTQRTWLAVAGAAALFALSACGDDADAGDNGSDGGDSGSGELTQGDGSLVGPVKVTYEVTGDVTLSGSATSVGPTDVDLNPMTCAEWADGEKHNNGSVWFEAPLSLLDKIDEKTVEAYVHVSKYDGPGTYSGDQLTFDAGGSGGIHIDDVEFDLPYTGNPEAELVVNDDGSGSYTFEQLDETSSDKGRSISGSMTWTCEDKDLEISQ
jgi:hypothetical protein